MSIADSNRVSEYEDDLEGLASQARAIIETGSPYEGLCDVLRVAKRKVAHGKWSEWCDSHLGRSQRWVQLQMRNDSNAKCEVRNTNRPKPEKRKPEKRNTKSAFCAFAEAIKSLVRAAEVIDQLSEAEMTEELRQHYAEMTHGHAVATHTEWSDTLYRWPGDSLDRYLRLAIELPYQHETHSLRDSLSGGAGAGDV